MARNKRRTSRREARGAERFMDMDKMHATFDGAGPALMANVDTALLIAAADLVRVAQRSGAQGRGDSIAAWTPPADLEEALRETYEAYGAAGRAQVRAELARQRVAAGRPAQGRRLAEDDEEEQDGGPSRPTPGEVAAALAAVGAAAIALKMRSAVQLTRGREDASRQALEGIALREGSGEALRWSVHVSRLVSLGRAAEARASSDEIEDAVYSAILDGSTCSECSAMDGEVTTDLDKAAGWTPNPNCHGGGHCRCVTVYELRQAPPTG